TVVSSGKFKFMVWEARVSAEKGMVDARNFVKKAVNWALRQIGKRNPELNRKAIDLSEKLAVSKVASARWIGTDALKELTSEAVQKRLNK
ncbi:MAG: DNA alkylation repair protein, partial [Halobacteriota archaeon]